MASTGISITSLSGKIWFLSWSVASFRRMTFASRGFLPDLSQRSQSRNRRRNVGVVLTDHTKIPLHDLVPLYLAPRTPALSARRDRQEELFFIDVSLDVLFDPCNEFAFTDGNAASSQTQFFRSLHHLDKVPWDVIQAEYRSDHSDGRRRRCAEFLVYPSVTPRYFSRLVVVSPNAAKACVSLQRRVPESVIHPSDRHQSGARILLPVNFRLYRATPYRRRSGRSGLSWTDTRSCSILPAWRGV